MNSNHHEAVKDESRCISECEDESFKSEGNALFEITQQVSTNSTFNIQMDHTNHKAIFPNMETTHGVSEKNDNRDCFDFDQLLHAEFTENTNITLAPALKNEETLLEGDAYEFNDTGKEKDDNSFSNTCNLQIVKPVQNYKATIDKVESSSKVLNESDFMPSFSNQSKIILCSKKTIEDSAVPKFFSSNVLDQNTANVNYCSSSPVSTNSNNLDSVHVIKNQPLIMSAKPLLSEITQTTAKVSIGNTTISVPLLKPVCTPKYVQDATDINKNPKSKLSYQQSRKLFSQINSKNSTTLSVNRGQKINPPTIVSLSQLQIKPSNNAKIVQATVVSNKLHLHSSVDVPTQSALITTPIRVKPNCTQKFVYPKQVNVSNDNANQSQQTEEVQLSLKHKLSVFSELKKTATKESFSESENQIQCNFSSSVINKKGLQSSESLMISDKFLDSISTAVKQNMQAKSRLESLSDAASLENNIASEISPIIPSLISPIEMSINKTFQKSSALREGGRQITTTSTSGATTGITAVYATSTAPISDRIVTPSIANSCTLSKKSVTSFLNIPRTLSLMLSKNTANQNTSTVMPMIIGDQSTISRCITDRITKNNQFPKTITLKKTENVNSQRYRPTPIHLIPINTSLTQVNIEKSSELLDLPCEHKDLGLTLKNKHINKDSENLNLLTHNTTLQQVNNSTYSAVSKNQQDDKILETTQNSMIFSTISDDMKTLSTENCLTSNTIHEPKLNSHKTNEVESSSKIEDSQNILLKQLLKNSSLNNNLSMSSMTAAQTSICSQVLSSRKIINVRAPSLGLVSSLEAQLARPVIPPVPATTGVTRSNCIAVEPINKQLDHNTNILDCKVKQPIKIISKETSFVSNPKFCSSTYTNRTALDEVSSYPSLDVNTTNADRMLDKVSELRSSPSEEFFSSFKGKLKLQNSGADFLNLSEKNVTSDEKITFQPSESIVGSDPKTTHMSKQTRYNSSPRNSIAEKKSLHVNFNYNKSPDAPLSSTKLAIRKNYFSGEESKDSRIANLSNPSTFNEKCGDQLSQTISSSNLALENIYTTHVSNSFAKDTKLKNFDASITNVNNNEILTTVISRKLQEIKSEGTAETKQKKKRKREFNNISSNREDVKNLYELPCTKKRLRKCLKTEEDYDIFMDNLVIQMKHMTSLDVLEPNLGQNFALYNMQGMNERLKLLKNKDLLFKNFVNDQINPKLTNILDFYEEQPFGFLRSTLKNNLLHMQNDFYDQEFLNYSFANEQKKFHKLLNCMKSPNFDLSENIFTKSYTSNLGDIQCASWPQTSFPGLVVINNADRMIGRKSPVIPLIKPISMKCDSFYATGPSGSQSKNFTNIDIVKSDSKIETSIRKRSMHTPNEEHSNLMVILTVSSMEVLGILRDLASLLNITPISSYKLLKDNASPRKDVFTYTKDEKSFDIQAILNGSVKFCRNCGFSSTKISIRTPIKIFHNHGQNLNNLRTSSGYLYFCKKACLTHFMRKNIPFTSKSPHLKDLTQKSTLQKHLKNMPFISKKVGIKKCRFKYFNINCLTPRVRSKRNHKGIENILFDLDITMSPSYINQTIRKDEKNRIDTIRLCILCNKKGDDIWNGASRLLNVDVDKWVHLNCALWSHGVYETISGGLVNVEPALEFGKNQACCSCHQFGATIKCFRSRCDSLYHLLCAKQEQCVFYKNKFIHCQTHYSKSTKDNVLTSLNVKRRVFIERDENQQVDVFMQLQDLRYLLRVGSVIFLNVGQLLPHQLKEFHTANYIYPVGYKAVRFYWSMKTPNKRCRYLCTITEVESRPEFTVQVQDINETSFEVKDSSPNAVWKRILEQIVASKTQQNLVQIFPKFISGDDFFGLNEPSIVRILENLPGVETLNDYRFKFGRNPLLEVPLHISGAARTEPQQRQVLGSKKPHTQRTATSATQRLSNSMIVGEVACPYSKQFVHSKSSQYKKMNQEWRNNVYLARSKIQGLGLYAARDLEKHTMVIEYIGEVIRTEVSEKREKQYETKNRGIYMFRLDEERIVDATLSGGLARYINHSCNPNCVTEVVDVERDLRIIIFAKRRINRGEELSYDYKFDIEDDANKLPCMCGATNCRKRMN